MGSIPQRIKLKFSSGISALSEMNRSFDRGRLKIAYHGRNRNGSQISKQAFEAAIPTMYNCPVVCNYLREQDEIGSHDVEFVKTDEGVKMVNVTTPVGVVPESASWQWELHDDNGVMHEYLCTDVYIWKRQEAYQKIKENGITDESMEISVKAGHTDEKDDVYVIDSFEFLAFCLLGTAEPCYESAGLEVFSLQEFRNAYDLMLADFKESFSLSADHKVVETYKQNIEEGGNEQLDKNELLAKFGLSVDELDFDIDSMTLEELEAKLNERFSLSAEQFRDGLIAALEAEKIDREWGTTTRYWYQDYAIDAQEVYAIDCNDYLLYGFKYAVNGDNVKVDFDSKKRKKIQYADFDEGDADFSYQSLIEAVAKVSSETCAEKLNQDFSAERTSLEEKFNSATQDLERANAELDSLRQFKEEKLAAERTALVNEVFSAFEDLVGNEAFEALRNDCAAFSIDELEDKCFAIRGRNASLNFAKKEPKTAPRLPIEKGDPDTQADEPYGGLMLKFPPRK